ERPDGLGNQVAIVGMAGRLPGAADLEQFWRNLRDGVESIARPERDELERAGVAADLLDRRDYVRAKGCVDGADEFDAAFFGISSAEAELMDPQHRLFLECAWSA